ncbi:hypothetical protein [Chitinimonas sp.]|uniref:hypothetical protein n=1 Tax=Chitinimonas sp. TaxID=1934313 RepID=UPI0035AF71FE
MKRNALARQSGQAMVEAQIAIVCVLLPLFIGIPLVARYIDIRQTTVEAARYAAWERSVWYGGSSASSIGWFGKTNRWVANAKDDDTLRKEIAARVLKRTDSTQGFAVGGGTQPLWVDHGGTTLLPDYDAATALAVNNGKMPGTVSSVIDFVTNFASTLGAFTLEMRGRYGAQASITLKDFDQTKVLGKGPTEKNIGENFNMGSFLASSADVTMTERSVLLANGWNAEGPDTAGHTAVKQQVAGLTPLALFTNNVDIDLGGGSVSFNIMNLLQTLASVFAPELGPGVLEFGKIMPDEVPEDRVK